MRNKKASVIVGLIAIAVGVGYGLAALGYIDSFTVFIKGWWTVFIILPGLLMLFRQGTNKFVALCLVTLGTVLFLQQQDIIQTSIKNLILPAIIILFGFSLIFNAFFGGRGSRKTLTPAKVDEDGIPFYETSFGEVRPNYSGKVFNGCNMDITFGSGKLDLRNAIITKDVTISVNAAFAGVKIKLPPGCRVDVQTSTSFGGITNKYISTELPTAPLVTVYAAVSFGGVDVK